MSSLAPGLLNYLIPNCPLIVLYSFFCIYYRYMFHLLLPLFSWEVINQNLSLKLHTNLNSNHD